jgi:hypothetical protein
MTPAIVVTPFLLEPVDALLIVVVAFSWVFILYVLAQTLVALSQGLRALAPPPVRPLFDWLAGQANALDRWAKEQAAQRLLPITHLFRHIDNRLRRILEANTGAHNRALAALRVIRFDVIPRVQNALIAFTQARTAAVLSFVQAVERQLLATVDAVRAELVTYTTARTDALLTTLLLVRAQLLADDRAIIAYSQSLTATAMLRADQEFERAVKLAQLDDQQVITYAQSLATQSQQYARQLVANQQSRTDAQVADLQRQVTSTATAILTLVLPLVATLADRVKQIEDSPCQQQCRTLGQLGNDLGGLDLAALLALLIGAAEHPHEAAPLVRDLLTPGSTLVSGELLQLFRGAR